MIVLSLGMAACGDGDSAQTTSASTSVSSTTRAAAASSTTTAVPATIPAPSTDLLPSFREGLVIEGWGAEIELVAVEASADSEFVGFVVVHAIVTNTSFTDALVGIESFAHCVDDASIDLDRGRGAGSEFAASGFGLAPQEIRDGRFGARAISLSDALACDEPAILIRIGEPLASPGSDGMLFDDEPVLGFRFEAAGVIAPVLAASVARMAPICEIWGRADFQTAFGADVEVDLDQVSGECVVGGPGGPLVTVGITGFAPRVERLRDVLGGAAFTEFDDSLYSDETQAFLDLGDRMIFVTSNDASVVDRAVLEALIRFTANEVA